jgi:Uma2 family endonuclease
MSYEEFLEWADEDTLAEWVDGEIIMTSPASLRHQAIAFFLNGVLDGFARPRQLGRVVAAPFQMRLETSGREPDVLFVAAAHMDRLKPTYLDGPADLAVEVVSPESAGRDRGDKYYEYERAGITEYWLIDPQTERAEFYQLDAAERYHLILPDGDGLYHSAILPGLWLRVAWLWQDPPPPAEDALLAIEGEALIQRLRERLGGQGEAPSR